MWLVRESHLHIIYVFSPHKPKQPVIICRSEQGWPCTPARVNFTSRLRWSSLAGYRGSPYVSTPTPHKTTLYYVLLVFLSKTSWVASGSEYVGKCLPVWWLSVIRGDHIILGQPTHHVLYKLPWIHECHSFDQKQGRPAVFMNTHSEVRIEVQTPVPPLTKCDCYSLNEK